MYGDGRAEITLRQQLEQERTLRRDLEQQLAAHFADQEALEKARSKDVERQLAARQADQELLAKERARSRELKQRLAARHRGLDAPASVPVDRVARTEAPAPPQVSNEAVRLMAHAKRLLEQGNIAAARSVLERAAEAGNALATFMLAESYDPIVLAAWGTVGTQGDAAKAQQLYAKAAVGGTGALRAKADLTACRRRVRSTLESGRRPSLSPCPLSAKSTNEKPTRRYLLSRLARSDGPA
jgi:TPR repeat protein